VTQTLEHWNEKASHTHWNEKVIVSLKFLILAAFYLHLGCWLFVSVLLVLINVFTLLFGPWAVLPIGSWAVGLYLHLLGSTYILHVAGTNADELGWVEKQFNQFIFHSKSIANTVKTAAIEKYENGFKHVTK